MDQQPLVSIVTPSYNSALYIERTIQSVLAQDYPRIEYIVMDGGSTDETLSILERYRDRLEFHSARDKGPTDALNQGFARSQGSILAWLNADDEYLPGAVTTGVRHLQSHPEADIIYGHGKWIDENGADLGSYPTVAPYRPGMFEEECGICQPATFMRREALNQAGGFNLKRNFCFDYDLWVRMARRHRFLAVPEVLAATRMHKTAGTLASRRKVYQDTISLLREEYGYVPVNWVYGYVSFLKDGNDQYFSPLRHSPIAYLVSLFAGTFYNWRHTWRFWTEWASRLRIDNVLRAWKSAR